MTCSYPILVSALKRHGSGVLKPLANMIDSGVSIVEAVAAWANVSKSSVEAIKELNFENVGTDFWRAYPLSLVIACDLLPSEAIPKTDAEWARLADCWFASKLHSRPEYKWNLGSVRHHALEHDFVSRFCDG